MTQTEFPAGLAQIAEHYDAILCDVWGVIHNGRRAFDESCEALVRYRDAGGAVILITNAPVPKAQVTGLFDPLGVPADAYDDVVSSGDATRDLLSRRAHEVFWRFGADEGWEHDRFLYDGLDIQFGGPNDSDAILCIGLEDQLNDDPEDYRDRLARAADRNMEMICANPDIQVRVGDQLLWCAGALAQIYEQEGGDVVYPGKPHRAIYDLALQKLQDIGVQIVPDRLLCIGDGPATDIKGAQQQGYDALYVGTGLGEHGEDFVGEVQHLLRAHDVSARWAMPALSG